MGEITDALRRAREEREGATGPEEHRPREIEAPGPPRRRRRGGDPAIPLDPPLDLSLAPSPGPERQVTQIPRTEEGQWQARVVLVREGSPAAEGYRQFALRVLRELERRSARSVLVMAALRQEGKTTTTCNLALALASLGSGQRVALVDLDLRRPAVAGALGIPVSTGIEQVLRGEAPLGAARVRTDVPDLDVYPVRAAQRAPESLVAGSAFPALLKALETAYGTVVIDSPPVLLVPDTPIMALHAGGCLLVARSGRTRTQSVRAVLESVPQEKLLGCFLNEGKTPMYAHQYGYYLGEDEGD